MIIRPKELAFGEDFDNLIDDESNVKKYKRDFYIHDIRISPFSDNLQYAYVTQVNKMLINELPDDLYENIIFDRPINERNTFVKVIYIYNATLNSLIPLEESLYTAKLKPLYAIITGMTDTERVLNDFTLDSIKYIITLYNFQEKHLMRLYDINQLEQLKIKDYLISPFEFDIPDPRTNSVHLIHSKYHNETSHHTYSDIPMMFEGYELIRNNSKIHIYQQTNNSGISIYDIAQQMENENNTALIIESGKMLDRTIAIKNLLVDMVKISIKGMFGEFTLIYDTTKGYNIKRIKTPFTTTNLKVFEEYIINLELEFLRYCEKVSDKFGDVRIMLNINDIEHVATCIFKDSIPKDTIKLRMSKYDCINDYIFETLSQRQVDSFMKIHDLDKIDFMSKNIENNRILVNYN